MIASRPLQSLLCPARLPFPSFCPYGNDLRDRLHLLCLIVRDGCYPCEAAICGIATAPYPLERARVAAVCVPVHPPIMGWAAHFKHGK